MIKKSHKKITRTLSAAALALILTLTAGCSDGNDKGENADVTTTVTTAYKSNAEMTWSEFYKAYSAEKTSVYKSANSAISASGSTSVNDSICMLYMLYGDVDLAYASCFFGDAEVVKTVLESYGFSDVVYSQKDETASASCKKDGNALNIELKYNSPTGTAQFTITKDGKVQFIYSICRNGEYIAKNYIDNESGLYIEVLAYTKTDSLYVSVRSDDYPFVSLFRNAAYSTAAGFAANGEYSFSCIDGVPHGSYATVATDDIS